MEISEETAKVNEEARTLLANQQRLETTQLAFSVIEEKVDKNEEIDDEIDKKEEKVDKNDEIEEAIEINHEIEEAIEINEEIDDEIEIDEEIDDEIDNNQNNNIAATVERITDARSRGTF